MLESFSTNATIAKIRTIHGKMFTAADYKILAEKRNIADVAAYLQKSERFHDALASIDTNTIHRGYLEELLTKSNFDMYIKLCSFQQLDSVPFYQYLVEKHEIEQILSLISSINSSLDNEFVKNLPAHLIKTSKLDFLELSKCSSLEDLQKALKGTKYYKVTKNLPKSPDGNIDYLKCEIQLREFYFENLFSRIKKDFSASDAAVLEKLIKSDIDLTNIINAYRMKAYFKASAEDIKSKQLPFTRIGKHYMNSFYECETAEDMIAFLQRSPYAKLAFDKNPEFIETDMQEVKYQLSRRLLISSQSAPVVFYTFLQLCDIEVWNIIHIIEAIRYELAPSVIEKQLLVY